MRGGSRAHEHGVSRLVLFDLDGTLVDSAPGIWASVRAAAVELGLPEPTPAQLPRWSGRRCRTASPRAGRAAGATSAGRRRLPGALRRRRAARRHRVRRAPRPARRAAGADGATLAVATSKPELFAVRVLEVTGLLAAFASVHGATLDGAVRHKDQVVAAALAAHPGGGHPVLIGDRAHDVLGRRGTRTAVASARAGGRPRRRAGGGRRRGSSRPAGRRPAPPGRRNSD